MTKKQPVLYIFASLPATGKSTLAQELASHINATYLRIDTVEQAIADLCSINVVGEGYRLSYRVASDNLKLDISVVADSCNPIELSRREWEQVAKESNAAFVNIEITCSDKKEHREKVENRVATIPNLKLPSWDDVESREYHSWSSNPVKLNTAFKTINESFSELIAKLNL